MTSNKSLIRKAKKFYFEEWRGHEKISPAFGEKVFVTRLGWEHVVHNPRHKLSDVVRRLKSLQYARKLLETFPLYQERRSTVKYDYYAFWGVIEEKRVKVVVSSPKSTGKKYFFSVMVRSTKKGSVSPL